MTGTDARPLYAQIRDRLMARITLGEFAPGAALPSEGALARSLGVSTGTVRKAVDALVAGGTLIRRQGLGTFVARVTPELAHFRFFRIVDGDGLRVLPVPVSERLRRRRATQAEAARLGLGAGAAVFDLERLRALGGAPAILERILLPARRLPGFAAAGDVPNALYPHFQERYGITVGSAEDRLSAAAAEPAAAAALGLDPGAPVLVCERIARDLEGRPVEWRRSLLRPGRWAYSATLP